MKHLCSFLLLIFILAACAPAAPVPTTTAVPPTESPIPTDTPTTTPTAEPTATLTPTPVPMPEGWSSIAEIKEIGGRQVVVNEKGEGATQIDGDWYPVDVKGCYYKEFFDPINQTDPIIYVLTAELYTQFGDLSVMQRHFGISHMATLKGGYPRYFENVREAIIYRQMLCLNSNTHVWSHIIQYAIPIDSSVTPESTRIMRVTVGWMHPEGYLTFTYVQNGEEYSKAKTLSEAFSKWQSLIDDREHVRVRIPKSLTVNNLGHWPEKEYGEALRKLVLEAPKKDPFKEYQENINDPDFIEWALSENNQIRYWGDKKNWYTYCHNNRLWHKTNLVRCEGEQASDGLIPEIVARVILVP